MNIYLVTLLSIEGENPPSQTNRDPDAMAEARIDIKKLATFLHSQQVGPLRVICSKCHCVCRMVHK